MAWCRYRPRVMRALSSRVLCTQRCGGVLKGILIFFNSKRFHRCSRTWDAINGSEGSSKKNIWKINRSQHGSFVSDSAKCRIELERTRLLVFEAADQLDRHRIKKARGVLAMAKVAAPNMVMKVLDTAMQVHGAAGVSGDTVLSHLWATARTLRIADGPDEVHLGTIAKLELQRAKL